MVKYLIVVLFIEFDCCQLRFVFRIEGEMLELYDDDRSVNAPVEQTQIGIFDLELNLQIKFNKMFISFKHLLVNVFLDVTSLVLHKDFSVS